MKYFKIVSIAIVFVLLFACGEGNNDDRKNGINESPVNPYMEPGLPPLHDSIADTTNRSTDKNDTLNYERRPGTSPVQ